MPIELRPSAASRWIACPASARLSKDIPPTPSGDAAQAGTAIHALAEMCWQFSEDPMKHEGEVMEGVTLAKWHCDMAQSHLDLIELIGNYTGKNNIRIEHKVSYAQTEKFTLRGTADVLAYHDGTLIIADLKTGAQYVDENSDQLKIYALAAIKSMNLSDVELVELHINQPRVGAPRVYTMSIHDLRKWESEVLIPAIMEVTDENAQPRPSEKACQYCPAKLTCPAQKESFEIIEAQPNITAMSKEDIKAVMVRLSDQQVSDLLDRAPVVESFIDALRKHALERMKDGGTLPGWQLAPKRAARKWKDEKKANDALIEAGIKKEALYCTEFITPAAAEKLLDKEQRGILEELTVKESSGITIARDASLRQ
jgi:hypothetical protein